MAVAVTALATTPVKGLRVVSRSQVEVDRSGAAGDRRFHLVDDRGRMVNAKSVGALLTIVADLDGDVLALTFPGGAIVEGPVELGATIDTRLYSSTGPARLVLGGFSAALSEHAGRSLRLVEGVDRSGQDHGYEGAVSLMSRASLRELGRVAGTEDVDARRFRMLVEVDGVGAHEEDGWIGARVRVGGALVRFGGHVGRCSITHRHPESGVVDLPTLDVLRSYRGGLETTEPLAFGIYGEVLEAGTVAVGDAVTPA